jgi:aminoglycoside phosphotransferase (APT) family kinase protein
MSQPPADTRPVAPQHAIDTARLAAWLHAQGTPLDGPLEIAQFKGGQSNPTYLLTAGSRRYVLRRKPPGKLLPSAHAVDREFRVIRALEGSSVPVAHALALCEDESVIGTAFYVMAYVSGRVFWDPRLPGLEPAARAAIYDELNRVIAALHSVDYAGAGLGDYGRTGEYIARQVARWSKQYQASETEKIEAMDNLIAWLPANIPAGDETSIVHGDYRIDNVIFHPVEPRILAVLDWELSTLGHPLADFGYHCMTWRIPTGTFRGLGGSDFAALGVPTERDYVAAYCRRTGRAGIDPRDWDYYMVYNMFRIGAIAQGVMARALQGNASSERALETGRVARPLAELAWQQVERLRNS